jgi:protein gp37
MKTTKIDWCDCTINPVVGCPNGCPYCYARKINDRFHFVKDWNAPEFFPERLKQLKTAAPKSVFMDSMSDFAWWTEEQANKVYFDGICKNRQHSYIFLTKGYKSYPYKGLQAMFGWRNFDKSSNGEQLIFLGKTVTSTERFDVFEQYDFYSIEPLLEPIDLSMIQYHLYAKAVIIGAETGNRKGKIVPPREWIDNIVKECDKRGVSVFMKESLRNIMGADFRQDELPWNKRR